MQINDALLKKTATPAVATAPGNGAKAAVKPESAVTTAVTSESVVLSKQGKELAASTSVFDSKKVEEIKAAIAGGTFKVDASKVAAGLIDSVRDINQRNR